MIELPPSGPVDIEVRDDLRVLLAVMLKEAPGIAEDIAESLGANVALVQAQLDRMVEAGTAEEIREGDAVWYRVAPS